MRETESTGPFRLSTLRPRLNTESFPLRFFELHVFAISCDFCATRHRRDANDVKSRSIDRKSGTSARSYGSKFGSRAEPLGTSIYDVFTAPGLRLVFAFVSARVLHVF